MVKGFLRDRLHPRWYRVVDNLFTTLPRDVWGQKAPASGKHHSHRPGGTIEEHTLAMLEAFWATKHMWIGISIDRLMLAIAFHDVYKRGATGRSKHTDRLHDLKAYQALRSPLGRYALAIKAHMGKWGVLSEFYEDNEETIAIAFMHILDMLESHGCLKR